jgi:hypothetical protein
MCEFANEVVVDFDALLLSRQGEEALIVGRYV